MLYKIRNSFKSEYIPDEEISADESIVPLKGRLSFKQYLKDKRANLELNFGCLRMRPALIVGILMCMLESTGLKLIVRLVLVLM